jgi:hypothetical protein
MMRSSLARLRKKVKFFQTCCLHKTHFFLSEYGFFIRHNVVLFVVAEKRENEARDLCTKDPEWCHTLMYFRMV